MNLVTNVTVKNKSKTVPITVSLSKTEGPNESTVSHLIEPGNVISIPKDFDGGCAKMSVFVIRSEDVDVLKKGIDIQHVKIWEGNIPACNDVTLEMDPEHSQVRYKGRELPKCTACDVSKDILVENAGGSNIGGSNIGGSNIGGSNIGGSNIGGSNIEPWYKDQRWYWYALLSVLVAILLYLFFSRKRK